MLKFSNRKGSALMQVLVLGSVIASIVLLVLRLSITRTTNVVKTKRKVSAKAYAEACLAQYNAVSMTREEKGLPPIQKGGFSCTIGDKTITIPEEAIEVRVNNPVMKISVDVTDTDKLK